MASEDEDTLRRRNPEVKKNCSLDLLYAYVHGLSICTIETDEVLSLCTGLQVRLVFNYCYFVRSVYVNICTFGSLRLQLCSLRPKVVQEYVMLISGLENWNKTITVS